jgi:site-specific DNA-cytosine methylase
LLDSEVNKRKIGLIHEKDTQSSRVYSIHGKAICLSGAGGGGAVNMGQYLIQEARAVQTPRGKNKGGIYDSEKAPTMSGNDYPNNNHLACFSVYRADQNEVHQEGGRIRSDGKTFTSITGGDHGVLVARNAEVFAVQRPDKAETYQRARINDGDKAFTLCHGATNSVLLGCLSPDREEKRQNGQRFSDGEKFYTLTAQDRHGILTDGYIRKLTPIECERLQTVPDNFTAGVSDTQRYRMLGNGWTVDVIAHIFEGLK